MRLRPIIGPSDRTFGVCTKVWRERKKEREMSDLLRILVAGQAGQKIKVRTKKRVDDHRSDFLWM